MEHNVREQGHIAYKEKVCPTCNEKGDWIFPNKFYAKCTRCRKLISRKQYTSLGKRR